MSEERASVDLAIYHPSFGTIGGAELLAVTEARVMREQGVNAHIVTARIDDALWSNELCGIPTAYYTKHSKLRAFPWTTAARVCAQAKAVQPLIRGANVVIAHNYPCNMILGATTSSALRLWQVNEPSRSLYLPQTDSTLTERVRLLGDSATDWLTQTFALRLRGWEERLARGWKLASKRKIDGAMTAKLDGLYAISKYSQATARRVYGRCSDHIVYPSVRKSIEPAPLRCGIRRDSLQLLVQSRLEPIKNVETVLRGFALFAKQHAGTRMHVVGEGADRARLEMLAAELAPESVKFHSFLQSDALEALAAQCDVFALLPVDEPFGMVFTEAMTRGLLCIGPNHGGPNEILDEGAFGFVVDAFSPQAIADALHTIVALDDDEADARRGAAIESVQTRFSEAAMFSSLQAVLREHGITV